MSRPKLIFGSPETCADLLYATHFRAPDSFAYLEVDGKKHILLSDLEVDRGRVEAKVDAVDSYSEVEKTVRQSSDKKPSQARVTASWITSKGVR